MGLVFVFFLNIAEQIVLTSVNNVAATPNVGTEVNIYNGEREEPQENNSNGSRL